MNTYVAARRKIVYLKINTYSFEGTKSCSYVVEMHWACKVKPFSVTCNYEQVNLELNLLVNKEL